MNTENRNTFERLISDLRNVRERASCLKIRYSSCLFMIHSLPAAKEDRQEQEKRDSYDFFSSFDAELDIIQKTISDLEFNCTALENIVNGGKKETSKVPTPFDKNYPIGEENTYKNH